MPQEWNWIKAIIFKLEILRVRRTFSIYFKETQGCWSIYNFKKCSGWLSVSLCKGLLSQWSEAGLFSDQLWLLGVCCHHAEDGLILENGYWLCVCLRKCFTIKCCCSCGFSPNYPPSPLDNLYNFFWTPKTSIYMACTPYLYPLSIEYRYSILEIFNVS